MKCPKCGSPHVHRSRVRDVQEDIIATFTNQRFFRCSDCNHRFKARKPKGISGPVTTAKARRRRILFYLQALVIIIVIIVALVLLIMPYLSISKPIGRPR